MDEKRIQELVILYCKNRLTHTESRELQEWLQADAKHKHLFQSCLTNYRRSRQIACWSRTDETVAWHNIRQQIKRHRVYRYTRVAAVLAIAILSGCLYIHLTDSPLPETNTIASIRPGEQRAILKTSDGSRVDLTDTSLLVIVERNGITIEKSETGTIDYKIADTHAVSSGIFNTLQIPRGGEYSFRLSDGTKVWLNADSELTYPVVFDTVQREVRLSGEAYFEVTPDGSRPFIVRCGERTIRVLGTKFNIAAYKNQSAMITTLVEGSVQVSELDRHCILMPGEQAISRDGEITVKPVDPHTYTAWVNGTFEFENMPLEQITAQLGRWYDTDFIYFNEELKEIPFTGAAGRDRDLNLLLEMIERLAKVKFTRDNNKIIVTKQ